MLAVTEAGAFPRESLKELARILLYENTSRLPQPVEDGLIELVSTLEVEGTHITLGAPVPKAEQSRGWAMMHLLTVTPDYSGRTRVMISNLEQAPISKLRAGTDLRRAPRKSTSRPMIILRRAISGRPQFPGAH